ncbi:MAG TPA: TetR family transcriptional regulator [Pseudonocardiaceae bacterium]|jgi:AcrR family transcriptional regulator
MNEQVRGKRGYHSPRRAEQAAATRQAVLAAAWELFVGAGYAATTVAAVAARARVAVDTVYATVGRKPALLRELLETALSGTGDPGADQPASAEQRDYILRIRAARTAGEKITVYAYAIAELQQRVAPVFLTLRDAAASDPDCAALWEEISQRRAKNMRAFAADLRRTGELRDDLSDDEVADIVWSMNAAEYWVLLVHERGWTPARFTSWLIDAWTRLLLAAPHATQPSRT